MRQRDFIREVTYKFEDVSEDAVKAILDAMEEVIVDAIMDEDSVKFFPGFTIYGAKTKPLNMKRPTDGKAMVVPPHVEPRVKFGYRFKLKVRGGTGRDTDYEE